MRDPSDYSAAFAEQLRWLGGEVALIGAMAALRYRSHPRETTDVDFLIRDMGDLPARLEADGYEVPTLTVKPGRVLTGGWAGIDIATGTSRIRPVPGLSRGPLVEQCEQAIIQLHHGLHGQPQRGAAPLPGAQDEGRHLLRRAHLYFHSVVLKVWRRRRRR